MKNLKGEYVLVTTGPVDRGVFMGKLVGGEMAPGVLELEEVQNCLKWSSDTRGVFGLAAIGPQPGSRVGRPVPYMKLANVNTITLLTKEAVQTWQAQPWS